MLFAISYFYCATGMEGREDRHPRRIIEAENKERAAYLYWVTFGEYLDKSYEEFKKIPDSDKYCGLSFGWVHDAAPTL